jgi:putative tricarboxylic transport membrane protein
VRRADQVGGLGLLTLAVGYAAGALEYPYWGANGPGSAFMPFWLGVAMAILAVLLFVGASRVGDPGASWLPAGTGLRKLLVVVGATVLFVALLPYVGMIVGTGLFLLGILRFLERYPWTQAAGVAAGTAVANYLIFTYWLRVPFPVSVLGF